MKVLGLSAFHRDAAAALVVDGEVVAAVQEERFTRKPGESAFPRRAVRACLDQAGITSLELDEVVFAEKPLRKFERVLVTHLQAFPHSSKGFGRSMFLWLGDRLWLRNRVAKELECKPSAVSFCEHGLAHATAALFSAPSERAAILVLDDVGEWASTVLARGDAEGVKILSELHYPDSLGMLASALTQHLGLAPGEEELALSELAAHGKPEFLAALRELAPAGEGGAFRLDPDAFPFQRDGDKLYGEPLIRALGEAREPGDGWRLQEGDARHANVAASGQALLEERALELAKALHAQAPDEPVLSISGMLARNPRLLSRLAEDGPYSNLSATPFEDDCGAALGAALIGSKLRSTAKALDPALGPNAELPHSEETVGIQASPEVVAERLTSGDLVGWAEGRLELGASTHGGRSLIAAANREGARSRLLAAVQREEPWQPCGVLILAEEAAQYVEGASDNMEALGLGQLAVRATPALREAAPEAVGPDGRAQVQVIHADRRPALHALLKACVDRGVPALLQADMRLRGASLVRGEVDALDLFERSALDAMVVGGRLHER